jgi:LytS/YehU family sensor histidine kinase
MISRVAVSESRFFPTVLTFTDLRSYVFTVTFILLAVATPWAAHQFHLAGPTFLPMHIFVLLAGLLFGWRAGLAVGLFTPLASYAITGMPVIAILPQIVIELSCYGLVAGLLREKLNLRFVWALVGAMVAGRLALILTVSILSLSGAIYSPLGAEASPFAAVWSTVKQGWPGILIQLILIPFIVILLEKWLAHKKPEL